MSIFSRAKVKRALPSARSSPRGFLKKSSSFPIGRAYFSKKPCLSPRTTFLAPSKQNQHTPALWTH